MRYRARVPPEGFGALLVQPAVAARSVPESAQSDPGPQDVPSTIQRATRRRAPLPRIRFHAHLILSQSLTPALVPPSRKRQVHSRVESALRCSLWPHGMSMAKKTEGCARGQEAKGLQQGPEDDTLPNQPAGWGAWYHKRERGDALPESGWGSSQSLTHPCVGSWEWGRRPTLL